ncbi:MAG: hypothetical protein WHT46_08210 [Candidatus Geothermincolales bacterium]
MARIKWSEIDERAAIRKSMSYAVGIAIEIGAVLLLCLAALAVMEVAMLLAR